MAFSSGASNAATTESGTDINASLTVNSSSGDDGGGGLSLRHQGPRRHQLLTSRVFRGVVPQPNGRWGAQIYDGHARVWLGTFLDQDAAARAYDVAVLRFRGRDASTNFEMAAGQQQLAFLAAHSKSEIVGMLRSQTYADELLRHGVLRRGVPAPAAWARVPLFEKAVTQSDVSKLSRLVVPRKHAVRHLPPVHKGAVLLGFVDGESGKVWRFRYSYWHSSRSYVLTKGWIRFVREKGLQDGDTVAFSRWAFGPEEQLLIDYRKKKQPEKKDAGTADAAIAVHQAPVVLKLFGVDIAV